MGRGEQEQAQAMPSPFWPAHVSRSPIHFFLGSAIHSHDYLKSGPYITIKSYPSGHPNGPIRNREDSESEGDDAQPRNS